MRWEIVLAQSKASQAHVRSVESMTGGASCVEPTLSPASGGAGATVGAVPISVFEAVTVARLIGVVGSIRVSPVLCPRRPCPLRGGSAVRSLIRSSLSSVARPIGTRIVRCQTRVTGARFPLRRNETYRISTGCGLSCLSRIGPAAERASIGSRRRGAIRLGGVVRSVGSPGTVLSIAVR